MPGISNFKTYACAQRAAQLHAGNAQISRHPPHRGRDDRPNRSDALADRGAPPAPKGADTLEHFMAFVAIAFPLARTGRLGLLPVFIGASAFGAIIELIQPTFNRSADLNDWAADTFGVLIGIGLGLAYRRLRRHRS